MRGPYHYHVGWWNFQPELKLFPHLTTWKILHKLLKTVCIQGVFLWKGLTQQNAFVHRSTKWSSALWTAFYQPFCFLADLQLHQSEECLLSSGLYAICWVSLIEIKKFSTVLNPLRNDGKLMRNIPLCVYSCTPFKIKCRLLGKKLAHS
jgi:hypothetical protein